MHKKILQPCLYFFFPPVCLTCRAAVEHHGMFCAACWKDIEYVSAPSCPQCARPLEVAATDSVTCGACLQDPPLFTETRAVFNYNTISKKLILQFKNRGATYLAPLFAKWMAHHGAELLAEADLLIPIPLHWKRLVTRGYNQAALIVKALARQTGVPYHLRLLQKKRSTPSQGTLSAKARSENMKRVFSISDQAQKSIVGKRILLIDDVMSSGATVRSAAQVLLAAGAKQVDVLLVARAQL